MFTDGIPVPQTADLIVNVYAFLQHWNRLLQLRGQELLLQLHEMKNQSCRGNWAMGVAHHQGAMGNTLVNMWSNEIFKHQFTCEDVEFRPIQLLQSKSSG